MESAMTRNGKRPRALRHGFLGRIPAVLGLAGCLISIQILGAGEASADGETVRFKFGDIRITAFKDAGSTARPSSLLLGISKEDVEKYLPGDQYGMTVNAFVAEIGGATVLFDAGNGPGRGGKLIGLLKEAGFDPESIEHVALTHMHGDHVGGLLTKQGKAAFPKARLYVSKPEIDYWLDPGLPKSLPKDKRPGAVLAAASVKPYEGRIEAFGFDGLEILPGVTPQPAFGHTPGHTVYSLSQGRAKVLIIGDLIHIAPVQMPLPDTAIAYDVDPAKATASRKMAFEAAAKEGAPIFGMHLPFPGGGVLNAKEASFEFVPSSPIN
jgi:glyoxylase-like metal-dependent hydrolase (beta-lactamase superfamily II)